jgi:phosphatidylinositol-4,5-bisphosphate 3-kinase
LFNELLEFQFKICSLPRAARFSFTLYDADRAEKKQKAVATLNFPVFSFNGWMNTGEFECRMWLDRGFDFFLTTCQSNQEATVRLLFKIPEFRFPIGHVSVDITAGQHRRTDFQIPATEMERLQVLCQMDSLEPITPRDRELLWQYRHNLAPYPELLAQTLGVIDYRVPEMVAEIPLLLAKWQPPSPTEALTLLDAKFADQRVRAYAVAQIERFRDHEMMLYMLQLVQALKYELYDDSPLATFLLRHGLAEPKFFGHQLFWQLMSEAHLSHIRQRFSILVVNFIYGLGHWRIELIKGYKFTQQLVELNQKLSKLDFAAATVPFRQELSQIEIPHEFHLPMDPRLVVDSFIIEKCKVMNSKKKPFWLTFHNSSPFATEPVQTMFKVGDDLRQDQLTLQVLKVMEYLWRENGYEFHMSCYGVLPTGRDQGFIEVVRNAVTESELQKQRGAISGVWATDLFVKYFAKFNPEKTLTRAREIFRLSSAGYAVATSVLGVADRHPGNIMVQQDGHFFHIDFGHFLGHWKMKLGVKREGELFHFSPACAETIGEKDGLRQFEIDTQTAMAVLRKNSRLLVTLFLLMLGTGIPELNKPQDVEYIRKKLYLGMTDVQANAAFSQLIKDSMVSTRTKLNNLVHNIKQ